MVRRVERPWHRLPTANRGCPGNIQGQAGWGSEQLPFWCSNQVVQELGVSQQFPSPMSSQQGSSSTASEEAEEHKERPQSGADKAESHGNLSGTNAETPAESGTGTFPGPPLPIPLSRLREIEAELIGADEADTEAEPGEPLMSAVAAAAGQAPAPAAGDSVWHRAGAALQAALRDGSARYTQRDFAAAAAKFSTALEVRG
ncbi:spermatogenesis-associated protein 16-like isoform X1 [Corvus cornix cornix]|uniref:spermatogenesis-associated protein 16-like isoform X1 n=1 Tax=Corvus cornix cornix TaxID=932674 RepID=UPI00194FF0FD|nr:spermatogenesis-associated protein 16-like isoform X1 [Corvus cornix cornix]